MSQPLFCWHLPTEIVDYCQHNFRMASNKNDDNQDEREIGRVVVHLRRQANMTQEDLAGAAEIDRSYLSEIESGKKNISIKMLKKLAAALGVKASKLLGE